MPRPLLAPAAAAALEAARSVTLGVGLSGKERRRACTQATRSAGLVTKAGLMVPGIAGIAAPLAAARRRRAR